MHIVICDDVEQDAQETKQHLQQHFIEQTNISPVIDIVYCENELIQQQNIDLLFLDIELENESGITIAEKMNKQSPDTLIVFVSSYPFYVTDTYRVNAVQFLVKPLQPQVFTQVMQQVMIHYHSKKDYYIRRCEGEPMTIQKSQVVYIAVDKRILTAFLANGKERSYYGTLSEEEKELSEAGIIRCHKSYLVNLHYVQRIERKGIVLLYPDGQTKTVSVGESLYDAVYQAYLKFLCK